MKSHYSASWILCVVLLLGGCGGMNPNMMSPSLKVTTPNAPSGATAVRYNGKNGLALAATGGTPPYTWTWTPAPNSALPPGLTLRDNAISGAPEVTGDFRVVVTVTDSGRPAAQATATYTVAVNAPLKITSGQPPSGTVKVGYGAIGTIYLKCVWNPVLGWHQVCTRCDPAISGSCPANRTNCGIPQTCTKTTQNHAGFQFVATGGAAPYKWSGTSLPPGLGLYPTFGIMSGTPTTAGTYNITVTVKDSEPTPQKIQSQFVVGIFKPGACSRTQCDPQNPQILPPCCPGLRCVFGGNRSFCRSASTETPSTDSLREVPPLQLDKVPEITFPPADSATPQ